MDPNETFSNFLHSLLQALPHFYGTEAEDPKSYLREFERVCHSIFVGNTCNDRIFFKYFPYTLHDDARLWYDSLYPSAFSTWLSFRSYFFQVFVPHT